jgi:uncharacterized protein
VNLVVEKHISVPARDGVTLVTDVYRADDTDVHSAILLRTPYGKDVPSHVNTWINVLRAAESGWVVVVQDVRGRYRSEGVFTPFVSEAHDGVDTIDWIRQQPWSDGRVGMVGGSYIGLSQWLTAAQHPEGLIGIVPGTAPDDVDSGWLHEDENIAFGFLANWVAFLLASSNLEPAQRSRIAELYRDVTEERIRTFEQLIEQAGDFAPYLNDWRDSGRSLVDPALAARVRVPAFVIAGWFDIFARGAVDSYTRREPAGTRHANDRLLAGPWAHGVTGGWFPERSFGPSSSLDSLDPTHLQLAWLERVRDGVGEHDEPVSVFVMGANEWRQASSWPPEGTEQVQLRLLAETPEPRPGERRPAPPAGPVPTLGGRTFLPGLWVAANSGPRTLNALDERHDVQTFVSDPASGDLDLLGQVSCTLEVAVPALTPVVVKLAVLDDKGTAELLCEGSSRSTADGRGGESLTVDLGPTALRLPKGARLRIYVATSDFPRLEDGPRADLEVHHGPEQGPFLCLPVAPPVSESGPSKTTDGPRKASR